MGVQLGERKEPPETGSPRGWGKGRLPGVVKTPFPLFASGSSPTDSSKLSDPISSLKSQDNDCTCPKDPCERSLS